MINNLLSNAIKYGGDPPGVDMLVSCGKTLRVEIRDNGKGIPKEEQKHVFDKFFRGKDAKKMAIKGLGLGLYYVKQIVTAHGGIIELKSLPGSGAVFIIQIPANNEHITGGR